MPILKQNVTLDMTKTQFHSSAARRDRNLWWLFPECGYTPPWLTTKRQLQRLFFGDNVIHDNNNYTMYIPHDTFHISLTFIYTYVQVTSPQPPHIDGPHVTDGNPKIAGKWCIMFEFKFNHFNQRHSTEGISQCTQFKHTADDGFGSIQISIKCVQCCNLLSGHMTQ